MQRRRIAIPQSAPPKPIRAEDPPAGSNMLQSTPKTTAAHRFRSRYIANCTPNFSPKKKLDFDAFDTSDNAASDASPTLRNNHILDPPSTSSISKPTSLEMTPNSSRISFHEHSSEDFQNSSRASTIKPSNLASKFDCFSDSD